MEPCRGRHHRGPGAGGSLGPVRASPAGRRTAPCPGRIHRRRTHPGGPGRSWLPDPPQRPRRRGPRGGPAGPCGLPGLCGRGGHARRATPPLPLHQLHPLRPPLHPHRAPALRPPPHGHEGVSPLSRMRAGVPGSPGPALPRPARGLSQLRAPPHPAVRRRDGPGGAGGGPPGRRRSPEGRCGGGLEGPRRLPAAGGRHLQRGGGPPAGAEATGGEATGRDVPGPRQPGAGLRAVRGGGGVARGPGGPHPAAAAAGRWGRGARGGARQPAPRRLPTHHAPPPPTAGRSGAAPGLHLGQPQRRAHGLRGRRGAGPAGWAGGPAPGAQPPHRAARGRLGVACRRGWSNLAAAGPGLRAPGGAPGPGRPPRIGPGRPLRAGPGGPIKRTPWRC